jgi:hypothetical protein
MTAGASSHPQARPQARPQGRPQIGGSAALWASAMVIVALIILQAGRVPTASADMVSVAGGMQIMTTPGPSDELVYVLDTRDERLYVYQVVNQASLELLDRQDVAQMFSAAAAQAAGRR